MKRALKIILPAFLIAVIIAATAWFFLSFRPQLTANMLVNQAENMQQHGRHERAIRYYSWAWKLVPEQDALPVKLAQAYIDSGNYTKAEYVLVQAITASPSNAELYIVLCQTYVAQDKLLDAVQMLDRIADPGVKAALDPMRPDTPTVLPESGYYTDYVTLTADGGNTSVYLTTTGEYPTMSNDLYQEPVTLPGGESTVIAVAVDAQTGLVSPAALSGYTIGGVDEPVTLLDGAIDDAARAVLNKTANETLMTSDLWGITELVLEQPVDLSDLAHFTGLRSLTIQNVSGLDFTVLSKMLNLQYLDLSGCTISSNSQQTIGSLTSLQTLKLNSCALTNIDTMAQLTGLTELDLGNNIIENIGILSLMLDLQTVNLSNNPITSIAGLSTCKKLQYLDISNCDVSSLSSLNGKTELQVLLAPNNKISQIEDLSQCALLQQLDLQANLVVDISVLAQLHNLRIFLGDNNQIAAVPVFDAEKSTLQQFSIDYNQVAALSGLQGLTELNYVNADYNTITDLAPLAECINLVQVNVWDNPIKKEDVSALQDIGIIVNYNPNYKPAE